MDYFDAFDEVFASIDTYYRDHGHSPHDIAVSPSLYAWFAELQRESAMLAGIEMSYPVIIETPYGPVGLIIDERLSPYDVVPV
ncbi:MAG: hypothetical protein SGJ05_01740 [bacterium]|nr:hypothetical protein [bacterium]